MPESHWFERHAWLTVSLCALVGMVIGCAAGLSYLRMDPSTVFWAEIARPGAGLVAAAAGVLFGMLAGVLLIRVGRSGVECPRCGTRDPQAAVECSACGLSLG